MNEQRNVRGLWVSTLATYKKLVLASQGSIFPLGPPDYVCLVGSGPSNNKPKVWRVVIEDDIPDKDTVITALEQAFNANATRADLSDLWNKYDLWGHLVIFKLSTVSEKKRQETRALLGVYKPLLPSNVGCRVIEAMMNATPTSSIFDKHPAQPLDSLDKLMIYAVAVLFNNKIEEDERNEGIDKAVDGRTVVEFNGKDGQEKVLKKPVMVDMKFIADRAVDAFKRAQWRADQDVKELQERLMDSVNKLSKPFKVVFRDKEGRKISRKIRFISPSTDDDGKYYVSSLFTYLDGYYYEKVDFTALCDGYKELGGVFVNLKSVLGANRARLSRKNSKPIVLDELSLFSEEELKAIEDKSVSDGARKMRKQRATAKLKKAIERADDKADIKITRGGKITISPTATETTPTTDESKNS